AGVRRGGLSRRGGTFAATSILFFVLAAAPRGVAVVAVERLGAVAAEVGLGQVGLVRVLLQRSLQLLAARPVAGLLDVTLHLPMAALVVVHGWGTLPAGRGFARRLIWTPRACSSGWSRSFPWFPRRSSPRSSG